MAIKIKQYRRKYLFIIKGSNGGGVKEQKKCKTYRK